MGVDARMLVKTMNPLSAERVRELSVKLVEAFGTETLSVIKPGEFSWQPNGRHALEIVETYEQDGPDVDAQPGQQLIEVHLWGRYYGPGYERGNLHDYVAVAGWLEHHIAGCEVWYGGDSSGVCIEPFGEEQRRLAMRHFYEVGHAPYTGYFDEKSPDAPRCDFCRTTMIQNGYGQKWRAWYCAGCGQAIEERNGVRSVRKERASMTTNYGERPGMSEAPKPRVLTEYEERVWRARMTAARTAGPDAWFGLRIPRELFDELDAERAISSDLLAACKAALTAVEHATRDGGPAFLGYALTGDVLRAAIARAEGGAK